jgi:hypothetical protein
LYGIGELEEELQVVDAEEFETRDSLRIMTAKVDSLSNVKPSSKEIPKKKSERSGLLFGIVFGIIGLVLGVMIAIIAMKKRKT